MVKENNDSAVKCIPILMQAILALASLTGCVGSSGNTPQVVAPPASPPLVFSGNQITLSLSSLAANAVTGPTAAIRSSVNYYRHWNYSYQDYIAHTHQITRAVELNTALSLSTSAVDFRSTILNVGSGTKSGVMYQEGLQKSDNLIVVFDSMPAWLSSCSEKLGSASACQAPTTCGYNFGMKYYNLYAPNDWTAWTSIVTTTVDTLLDLTEWNGKARNVYLEAWNEPNVRECSWNDTHASFMDFYQRTSVAFTQARNALCTSKGYTAQRCQRLKFGGPAVGVWNGKIDSTRSTTLIEDLVADSLVQAASNADHRLDFVSFHGNWGPVPGPRSQISSARDHIESAYSRSAGSKPAIPMPEIIVSEWNGDELTRSGKYHPVVMAEAYYGLLENNISNAAIATLDAYANAATLESNDYGLLLPDTVLVNYRRPAYFVYSAFRNLSESGDGQPFYYANGTLKIVATRTSARNCYNLVLWDFAADPLSSAVYDLLNSLTTTTSVISQSYSSASYSGTVPSACSIYTSANPSAMKALCSDIYNGNCASIPTPTPSGGHACDAVWGTAFASAGTLFRDLSNRQSTTANINVSDLAGSSGVAQVTGSYITEDHVQTSPKVLALGLGTDGKSLSFSIGRNAVVALSNVCAGQ